MPKPQWGWFLVAVVAMITGIFLVANGFAVVTTSGGPPGGLLVAGLGLLSVWAFGRAFFRFKV